MYSYSSTRVGSVGTSADRPPVRAPAASELVRLLKNRNASAGNSEYVGIETGPIEPVVA